MLLAQSGHLKWRPRLQCTGARAIAAHFVPDAHQIMTKPRHRRHLPSPRKIGRARRSSGKTIYILGVGYDIRRIIACDFIKGQSLLAIRNDANLRALQLLIA